MTTKNEIEEKLYFRDNLETLRNKISDKFVPNFQCPEHHQSFVNKKGIDRCCINDCGKFFKVHDAIYDFIDIVVSNVWDPVFNKSKDVNIFKRYFDKFLFKYLNPIFNKYLIDELRLFSEKSKFIEMGCGEATASISLLLKRNYSIVLLDNNDIVLQNVLKNLKNISLKGNYAIVKDDFYKNKLCFPDKYFDVSYNIGTIEHFDNPIKAVIEMKRIAKRAICVVPAPSIYWQLGVLLRKIIEKDASLWNCNTKFYTLPELENIFNKAALSDIKTYQTKFLGLPAMNCIIGSS